MFQKSLNVSQGALARNISICAFCCKDHYDTLGIKKSATQAEVKSAYYKQSMIHHPDKNVGSEEAIQKFREITDAYEALSNLQTRRFYDRGLAMETSSSQFKTREDDDEDDDKTVRFYKSRQKRNKVPVYTGKTSIYDFDAWTRAHYSNICKKQYEEKSWNEFEIKYEKSLPSPGATYFSILPFILLLFSYVCFVDIESYDNVVINYESKDKSKNK